MKFVIQRVKEASVSVEGEVVGKIGKGFMILVGIGSEDTREIADRYIEKMVKMRIFEDSEGKTNLSLADVDGENDGVTSSDALVIQRYLSGSVESL